MRGKIIEVRQSIVTNFQMQQRRVGAQRRQRVQSTTLNVERTQRRSELQRRQYVQRTVGLMAEVQVGQTRHARIRDKRRQLVRRQVEMLQAMQRRQGIQRGNVVATCDKNNQSLKQTNNNRTNNNNSTETQDLQICQQANESKRLRPIVNGRRIDCDVAQIKLPQIGQHRQHLERTSTTPLLR
jgi:hypothetical protein